MFLFICLSFENDITGCIFKYISCSYLSYLRPMQSTELWYSNTSHVLIYRCYCKCFEQICVIQIHLMFLFITAELVEYVQNIIFKYISCSYLSRVVHIGILSCKIQIHLMFLFIQIKLGIQIRFVPIQIHLMFLFIHAYCTT